MNLMTLTSRVLFSEEEERSLFREFRSTTNETKKQRILTRIVINFTPLVHRIHRQFSGYRMNAEDMVGEGLLALSEAAYRYNPDMTNRFAAYAMSWIRGMMMAYITKNYTMVNYCTDATKKNLFFHLRKVIATEQKKKGTFEMDSVLIESVAHKLGVKVSEVETVLSMFYQGGTDTGLDQPMYENDDSVTFLDQVSQEIDDSLEILDQERFFKKIIQDGMVRARLDHRDLEIINRQILIESEDKSTLDELGSDFSISKERVRQIRNKSFKRLSKAIKNNFKDQRMNIKEVLA